MWLHTMYWVCMSEWLQRNNSTRMVLQGWVCWWISFVSEPQLFVLGHAQTCKQSTIAKQLVTESTLINCVLCMKFCWKIVWFLLEWHAQSRGHFTWGAAYRYIPHWCERVAVGEGKRMSVRNDMDGHEAWGRFRRWGLVRDNRLNCKLGQCGIWDLRN